MDETPDNYTPRSASPEDPNKQYSKLLLLIDVLAILSVLILFTMIVPEVYGIYVKGYQRNWQAFIEPRAVSHIIGLYFTVLLSGVLRTRLFVSINSWMGLSAPHSVAGGMRRWETSTGLWTCVSSLSWQHVGFYGLLCLLPILLLPWSEHPATDEDYYQTLWCIFLAVTEALLFFAVSVTIARGAFDIHIDGKAGIVSIPRKEWFLTPNAIYRLLTAPSRVIPLSSVCAFDDAGNTLQNMASPMLRLSLTNAENEREVVCVIFYTGFHLMNSARLVSLVAWLNENLEQARSINSSFIEQETEESLH